MGPALRKEVASLKQERDLLQAVVDALPFAMFWKDREHVFLGGNAPAAAWVRFSSTAEFRGRTDYDMPWTREEADAYRADDREVMTTGKPLLNLVQTQQQVDGSALWINTQKVPLRDSAGEIIGLLGWVEDITARKLEQEEQTRVKDEMIRAQAEALYELATPLLPVAPGVLVMPLIGEIDKGRSEQVMTTLLERVVSHGAHAAILDLTGMRRGDMGVMNALVGVARAVRLLGAKAIVTGLHPEVARTVVELAVDLDDLVLLSDLKSGIAHAIARRGAPSSAAVLRNAWPARAVPGFSAARAGIPDPARSRVPCRAPPLARCRSTARPASGAS